MTEDNSITVSMVADISAATGPVAVRMNNDYLFHALLQQNNRVLQSLIRSLLHLKAEDIRSVEIRDPIELGDAVLNKEFILDIKVELNSRAIIDLEMQVINHGDWPERSVSYLCRTFDNLEKGENYMDVRPVIQIGLLDFTLFPKYPEFYATYKLLNEKNYSLYSDKLRLSVVNLTCIDLATEEDRLYQIDQWAAFFKATTWEEIKMLAQNNNDIMEAARTVYQLTQDEKIRRKCQAREDYYRIQNDVKLIHERALAAKDEVIAQKDEMLTRKDEEIARLRALLAQYEKTVSSD